MRRVLAIDPGPETCGVVLYACGQVLASHNRCSVQDALQLVQAAEAPTLVAIERVQSYGISGASLLRTAEVCGRLWQQATACGLPVRLLYRREVLRALDVTGKGNRDSLVRQRLLELHGGSRQQAVGRKSDPGPLYGVAGHAWAALAVAVAALEGGSDDLV